MTRPAAVATAQRQREAGVTDSLRSLIRTALGDCWPVSNPGPGLPGPDPEDPGTSDPDDPVVTEPVLRWETNFTDVTEAQQYWGTQTGRWGEPAGENQYYTDNSNISINDAGNLVIEARRETAPDGAPAPYDYTSARVVTYGKQSVEVNSRIVARIKMPYTQGTLPAFWSVGLKPDNHYSWPEQGEIDIAELPGFGSVEGRRIWTGSIHGPAADDPDVDVKLEDMSQDIGADLSGDFHEYGVDWYEDRIIWHVDGVEVGRITQAEYEAMGGDWTPFSGAWPHYLILNVAVGNPWTGDPDATSTFPQQMEVDWVRVYELAPL